MMMKRTTIERDGTTEKMHPNEIAFEIQKAEWLNKKSKKHWGPNDRLAEINQFSKIEDITDKQKAERDNQMKVLKGMTSSFADVTDQDNLEKALRDENLVADDKNDRSIFDNVKIDETKNFAPMNHGMFEQVSFGNARADTVFGDDFMYEF